MADPKPVSSPASPVAAVPGVSVVIPAYNYARFLPSALDSALGQDYPLLEVIVVDDGSTDSTAEVVARYGGRVRYIHQKNAGLPAARNTGILAARHPFVAFLDADDAWLPGMLQRSMTVFARLKPGFAMVACDGTFIDAGGQPFPIRKYLPEEDREITARDILIQTRFAPSSVIVRREVFETSGYFDTSLRSSEDRDMWIRIASHYRIFRQGAVLVQIRKHGSNMSSNADRMKSNMGAVIRKSYKNRLVPRWRWCFWLRVLSFYHFQTSLMFNGQGRRGLAVRSLGLSLVMWPWFVNSRRLNQPVFFRLRTMARYLLDGTDGGSPLPAHAATPKS